MNDNNKQNMREVETTRPTTKLTFGVFSPFFQILLPPGKEHTLSWGLVSGS